MSRECSHDRRNVPTDREIDLYRSTCPSRKYSHRQTAVAGDARLLCQHMSEDSSNELGCMIAGLCSLLDHKLHLSSEPVSNRWNIKGP